MPMHTVQTTSVSFLDLFLDRAESPCSRNRWTKCHEMDHAASRRRTGHASSEWIGVREIEVGGKQRALNAEAATLLAPLPGQTPDGLGRGASAVLPQTAVFWFLRAGGRLDRQEVQHMAARRHRFLRPATFFFSRPARGQSQPSAAAWRPGGGSAPPWTAPGTAPLPTPAGWSRTRPRCRRRHRPAH